MASVKLTVDESIKEQLSVMNNAITKLNLLKAELGEFDLPLRHLDNAIFSLEKHRSKIFTQLVVGMQDDFGVSKS